MEKPKAKFVPYPVPCGYCKGKAGGCPVCFYTGEAWVIDEFPMPSLSEIRERRFGVTGACDKAGA